MEHAPARPAPRLRTPTLRDLWLIGLAAAVVAIDQLVKWGIRSWVERGESFPESGLIRIVHVTNSGAAFGMLQGAAPLLAVVSLVGIAAILISIFNPAFAHPLVRTGLALMFGGAIGNLIDRVYAGEVVDFVKLPNYPAFNVADSAITVGVIALLIGSLWEPKPATKPEST